MMIYKYLKDKEAFYTSYGEMLAERQKNYMSLSTEAEISMIFKLIQACTPEDGPILETMFQVTVKYILNIFLLVDSIVFSFF